VDTNIPAEILYQETAGNPYGKGQGSLGILVAVIRPANVLFEVDGVTEAVARESLRLAATKLPIKTKFISRHGIPV